MVNSYRRFEESYCIYVNGVVIPIDFASIHAHGLCIPRDVNIGLLIARFTGIGFLPCFVHFDLPVQCFR
jgi:hypothetical protein